MHSELEKELADEIGLQEPPIHQFTRPFQEFFKVEASSGIILMAATAVALLLANSPWAAEYFHLLETYITIAFGQFDVSLSLLHWINDGLMAIFFFLVGLEIKREILIGELSSPRKAALPIAAAIGGMLLPALIFVAFNFGGAGAAGWGIPMATDIAFALGVLALLGSRAPASLKIFLTALAIVDDLGAVLVIAVFYTDQIAWAWLAIGILIFLGMLLLNRLGVRAPMAYGLAGIVLWFAFLESGVHATIAGVLAAMTIPATARINTREFVNWGRRALDEFEACCDADAENNPQPTTTEQRGLLQALETAIHHVEAPLQRLEHSLEQPVAYVIMPIFAVANAGVPFVGSLIDTLLSPVGLGIIFGLVVGKQLGIMLFSWAAVRAGVADLPEGVSWRHIWGASWLAGIGFTMALFIDSLAFDGEPALLNSAKVAILVASLISGMVGYLILRTTAPVDEMSTGPAGAVQAPAQG